MFEGEFPGAPRHPEGLSACLLFIDNISFCLTPPSPAGNHSSRNVPIVTNRMIHG